MKKTLIASLISATSLFACCGPVLAADYYVVAPLPGKAAQVAAINVGLNSYTIPEAIIGSAYAGFDFKSVLSVTGDSAYNGSLVSWSVVSGALPAGLVLNADGTLSGTPTLVGTSNFTLKATYKTKMGQQVYQVVSLGISVGLATATLPAAKVNTAYAAFDFKPLLSVSGDPNYSVNNVAFSATGVPNGMSLSSAGVLSGTPTTKTAGANFNVVATYKTKTGQQAYTIAVTAAECPSSSTGCATWASGQAAPNLLIAANGRTLSHSSAGWGIARTTVGKSTGKWYWEVVVDQVGADARLVIGAAPATSSITGTYKPGYWRDGGSDGSLGPRYIGASGTAVPYGSRYYAGDTVSVLLDLDTKTIRFYKNCIDQGATGDTLPPDTYMPFVSAPVSAPSVTTTTSNFGQEPFKCAVPSGYNAGLW